jgi:hypothetical protein
MKGLQPGSYFAGDSLKISSSRPPPITADYLPSALMCLSVGQIGMAAPRRYQSRAILRTEESNRAARQTERSLMSNPKDDLRFIPRQHAQGVKVRQASARGKGLL